MDGLMEVGSFPFFQMLISVVCWVVFLYYLWMEFPVMRTHSIILVLIWNGMTLANILFHQNNQNFPSDIVLAESMYGTLIMLVVIFFTYFFWKAVSDTRDLHVQVHHVHEDVRVMEAEMYEHSLRGWGTLLLIWFSTTFISAWSGIHFVATRNSEQFGHLITHLITGVFLIPMLVLVIWYPQRMLGDNTKISTAAALTAEIEMSQGELTIKTEAKCPECSEYVKVSIELDGRLSVPCGSPTCDTMGIVGTECEKCNEPFPARFDCISCGVNIPYVDCILIRRLGKLFIKKREDFPTLREDDKLAYLDNACVTLKPDSVVNAISDYYTKHPGCGGRSVHRYGTRVSKLAADARKTIAKFINSQSVNEVVFTRNATHSLNQIAKGLSWQGR